ncbi:MAG: Flp pilus assembly complex ATPase component TadA [Ruminococcaceae bacterium]|nr:Flp pilus assembly complex ATPase component TadA [Oscillospiraceae bacterium]
MAYKRLGEILTDAGVISEEQLGKALALGREQKKRLGEVLIDNKIITERQLIDVLKFQLGVDFIDLTKVDIPVQMAQLLPKNIAMKHEIVPVRVAGDTIYVAMSDPLNFVAIEEVKSATKKRVIPMIATKNAADRAIQVLYGNENVSRAIDDMQKSMSIDIVQPIGDLVESGEVDDQSAPGIRLVNSIIERGAQENASDIHMEPRENGFVIRMRIDGVLHEILTVPQNLQSSVISRIKIMGDMDIAERRIPQDGRSHIRVKGRDIDLRISTLPTNYGEKVVVRFLEKSTSLLTSDGIGLTGKMLENYNELISNANGVILIAGPTGSGKTTTMYTMVTTLNREEVNLVTLEDPIEYNIDGVNQVQINEKVGMTFANGLRAILRQDPDIIAVGEIRDGETAEIAMRAAITGHLVLSTIHTNSAIATLDRLLDIGVEPYLIASALKGVIAQRLLRKICPNCKEPYIPDEDELVSMGLDPVKSKDVRFYRGKGCPECLNIGYRGRTAAFEMLVLNSEIKQKFRENAPHHELEEAVYRSPNFETMSRNVLRLVLEGKTTVSEAKRILFTTDL